MPGGESVEHDMVHAMGTVGGVGALAKESGGETEAGPPAHPMPIWLQNGVFRGCWRCGRVAQGVWCSSSARGRDTQGALCFCLASVAIKAYYDSGPMC